MSRFWWETPPFKIKEFRTVKRAGKSTESREDKKKRETTSPSNRVARMDTRSKKKVDEYPLNLDILHHVIDWELDERKDYRWISDAVAECEGREVREDI